MIRSFFILSAIICLSFKAYSQGSRINFTANSLEYDERLGKNVKRLIGNVVFTQENTVLYCDSAYFFPNNVIDAYKNIRMLQGDSLNLTGDHLHYDGNSKIAQVRGDVTLTHKSMVLKTNFLDYDRAKKTAYYYNHGTVTDKENTLTSIRGYYYSSQSNFLSIDSVKLVNPKYVMFSDTLKYNTKTKVSFFLGPTLIRSGDTSYVYCENGWYDTHKEVSQFNRNAFIVNKSQKLSADSIYYDRASGFGKAFRNVELVDTTEKIILRGHKSFYNQKEGKGMMTKDAVLIQISEKQSTFDSLYMHADTIFLDMDSTKKHRIFRAWKHVKIFKSDLQGKCDSLISSMKDSVINLYSNPVIWAEESQLSAEKISIYSVKNKINKIHLQNSAFIISKEDNDKFNQIKGKQITGFLKNNQLSKIDIKGNGQSIYYAKDDKEYIGANKAECTDMTIFRKDKKFDRIMFFTKPTATLYPVGQLTPETSRLKDFVWHEKHRPVKKEDIFKWTD